MFLNKGEVYLGIGIAGIWKHYGKRTRLVDGGTVGKSNAPDLQLATVPEA